MWANYMTMFVIVVPQDFDTCYDFDTYLDFDIYWDFDFGIHKMDSNLNYYLIETFLECK